MHDHPEGPRTLWTQVRDALPLLPETVDRGLELEQGRHPTVTELREALGFDLDLAGAQNAAREVRLPREEPPTDELLSHYIDSMYRGIASSRLVRVVVSEDDLTTIRAEGTVSLREGQGLSVLVVVDNQTEQDLDFVAYGNVDASEDGSLEIVRHCKSRNPARRSFPVPPLSA